ncbi:MAG: hypothetical protein H5U40_16445, partial [Polyangiaceae bacterium]|nr:hypothetical protein [Polyangiaceae bacterium]
MTRASLSAASALALSLLLVAEAHAQTAQAPAPAVIPPESPSVTSMPIAPEPEPESPARADDEERFRAFYVEAAVGYTWIDLAQFSSDNLVPDLVRVQGNGLAVAAGAGLQVAFLTFGLEGEWARYPDFDFGTLSLDLGFRLPVPVVQPYFRVGLGYGWILNVDAPDF